VKLTGEEGEELNGTSQFPLPTVRSRGGRGHGVSSVGPDASIRRGELELKELIKISQK
jgi:hypothetical protein